MHVGKLIVSNYVAVSIKQLIAVCFGNVGLCQLNTKLSCMQPTTAYVAKTSNSLQSVAIDTAT